MAVVAPGSDHVGRERVELEGKDLIGGLEHVLGDQGVAEVPNEDVSVRGPPDPVDSLCKGSGLCACDRNDALLARQPLERRDDLILRVRDVCELEALCEDALLSDAPACSILLC